MIFVWKGFGWLFLIIVAGVCALVLPFQTVFAHFGNNPDASIGAAIASLSAVLTLFSAQILERRDRKRDTELDSPRAQGLHSLYWISLANWGYLATLTASGLFIVAILSVK